MSRRDESRDEERRGRATKWLKNKRRTNQAARDVLKVIDEVRQADEANTNTAEALETAIRDSVKG